MRSKEVQVIPWVLADSNYVRCPSQRLDPQKTVFVGALHGMLNAEGLAHICNDLFGERGFQRIQSILLYQFLQEESFMLESTLTDTSTRLDPGESLSATPRAT